MNDTITRTATERAIWKIGDTVKVQVDNEVKRGVISMVFANGATFPERPADTIIYEVEYWHRQTLRAYQAADEQQLLQLNPAPAAARRARYEQALAAAQAAEEAKRQADAAHRAARRELEDALAAL